MTRLKQSKEESCQTYTEQQMDQCSLQEAAAFGSDFGATQHTGAQRTDQM
jgi:hypothetical protein